MSLTIAETAERTGLTAHTLRYYERDGLMLSVDRSTAGHRRYNEGDLEWIGMITRLRRTGMPIRDIRRYAELVRSGDGTEAERMAVLRRHREQVRAQLDETQAHLTLIERKIEWYAGRTQACD
ncbi:MerR family transcriptional regulator [Nocardioides sp. LHG3406-4]|uniref:MerR family transcriptional regulator n=1 Tax=Nocardioides sp. LHG3406-4 TaxID=2804575 RepID=UPI003CE7733C